MSSERSVAGGGGGGKGVGTRQGYVDQQQAWTHSPARHNRNSRSSCYIIHYHTQRPLAWDYRPVRPLWQRAQAVDLPGGDNGDGFSP